MPTTNGRGYCIFSLLKSIQIYFVSYFICSFSRRCWMCLYLVRVNERGWMFGWWYRFWMYEDWGRFMSMCFILDWVMSLRRLLFILPRLYLCEFDALKNSSLKIVFHIHWCTYTHIQQWLKLPSFTFPFEMKKGLRICFGKRNKKQQQVYRIYKSNGKIKWKSLLMKNDGRRSNGHKRWFLNL